MTEAVVTAEAPAAAATAAPAAAAQPAAATASPQSQEGQNKEAPAAKAESADLLFDESILNPEEKKAAEAAEKAKAEADMTPEEKAAADAKKAEEDKAKEGEAPPVLITDLTIPEDFPVPEEAKADFEALVKEEKWTKEQAQKAVDLHVKQKQKELNNWLNTKADWRKQVEKDPELGGQNLTASVKAANDVVRKFAGTEGQLRELQDDLILLGLGNKPSFIRLMNNISKATREDKIDGKSGHQNAGEKSTAQKMWPDMVPTGN